MLLKLSEESWDFASKLLSMVTIASYTCLKTLVRARMTHNPTCLLPMNFFDKELGLPMSVLTFYSSPLEKAWHRDEQPDPPPKKKKKN